MSGRTRAAVRSAWIVVLLVAAGCSPAGGDAGVPDTARPRTRQVTSTAWDTLFEVGGKASDTLLLRPRTLAAGSGRVYVFAAGDRGVKAFDPQGSLVWRFGRAGGGPGEFGNVVDMETDASGALWLADGALGRVAVLSTDGAQYRQVPAMSALLGHIVPTAVGLVGTQAKERELFALFDSAGRQVRSFTADVPGADAAAPVARQMATAHAGDGHTWAIMFPFGSPVVVFRDDRARCVGSMIEGGPFPEPGAALRPQVSAVSIAISDSSVYVLPRGQTEDQLRVVDEYSAATWGTAGRIASRGRRCRWPSDTTRCTSAMRTRRLGSSRFAGGEGRLAIGQDSEVWTSP